MADGHGARISQSPLNFLGWSFILNAMIFPFVLKYMGYSNVFNRVMKEAKLIFWVGGTLSYIVYGTIIWAFTQAPVPTVAALRETSIIFALLIGTFFLKEKFTPLKTAAVLTIFFGVILLKFF